MPLIKLTDYSRDFIIRDKTAVESGYVNNTNDSGGETNHGITSALAQQYKSQLVAQFGWDGTMRNLSTQMAYWLYKVEFWDKMKLDEVLKRHPLIADRMFDFGINAGKTAAVKFCQRYLNVMNNQGTLYKDIVADGAMGPGTLAALDAYIGKRGLDGVKRYLSGVFGLQTAYYIELAEKRVKDETFSYGWQGRVLNEQERYAKLFLLGQSDS